MSDVAENELSGGSSSSSSSSSSASPSLSSSASSEPEEGRKLSAIVLGATGAVGKALVVQLLKHPRFESVTCLVRRDYFVKLGDMNPKTDYTEFNKPYETEKLKSRVVDFDNIEESASPVMEEGKYDVAFCSLGSTIKKAGSKEAFWKIDHDYVLNTAKIFRQNAVAYFAYVSTINANASGLAFYTKTKGQVENDLMEVGFPRLSILRPSLLMAEREESRPGERLAQIVMPYISWIFPRKYQEIAVETVAKAMIEDSLKFVKDSQEGKEIEKVQIFESDVLQVMGTDPKKLILP